MNQRTTPAPSEQTVEPADWSAIWESEGLLCGWFATLLSAELDEATLARYRRGEAQPLLNLLRDEHGLVDEVARVDRALSQLLMFTTPQLELAADFAELFLADARSGAPPYASLYADEAGRFHGAAAERMEARLAEAGYAVRREVGEPADHLAIMLDYLARRLLSLSEAKGEGEDVGSSEALRLDTRGFLAEELCLWLPRLVERSAAPTTASDFYPAVLALTAAYLETLREAL
ncbi:molecular chaperone TorD [Halomonas saccharevitans]|uniref:Molecular chaperone TorD n=1 Tax=Halomonas saccharevitans TaxID=416872 RepID=A0ABU3NIF9_9GAMM|nr:molecular chaperone TorD [Halomonas saccharevitans]MDT8879941.1 molecular chaperone TorD [Halomonas saccharevitans]